MESGQTKEASQRVKSDATPCTLHNSVLFEFSPEVTQDGDHIADGILKMLRIKDQRWVRMILLQLGAWENQKKSM